MMGNRIDFDQNILKTIVKEILQYIIGGYVTEPYAFNTIIAKENNSNFKISYKILYFNNLTINLND